MIFVSADAIGFASTAPWPLIARTCLMPFRGTKDRVARCPGAFGSPRRIRSGFPRSTITSPFTYREVTSVAGLSAVEVDANDGIAIDTAVALPRAVRNSRRLIRFIVGSFFRLFSFVTGIGLGVQPLAESPFTLRRRHPY